MPKKPPIVCCPNCGQLAKTVSGYELYGKSFSALSDRTYYVCYPCDTRVGCHMGTLVPLGTMADRKTRMVRQQVHAAFDPLWQQGGVSRNDAYRWLATRMGMTKRECHIGKMDAVQCAEAVEQLKQWPGDTEGLAEKECQAVSL